MVLGSCRIESKLRQPRATGTNFPASEEVGKIYRVAAKGVLVGRVVETLPHPCGDLIWLAKVDIGADRQLQIVWGGVPVVTSGSLVPVALPGTWLPATKDKP